MSTPRAKHLREAEPLDELHGEEVDAAFVADRIDRHDVRVFQIPHRLRFEPEAAELAFIGRGDRREHLQGDAAIDRDLPSLVDNPHSPPAHLADEHEVAELSDCVQRVVVIRVRGPPGRGEAVKGRRAKVRHPRDGRKQPAQFVDLLGPIAGKLVEVDRLSRGDSIRQPGDLLDQLRVGGAA